MSSTAKLLVRLDIVDSDEVEQVHVEDYLDDLAALAENGKREKITLANGFTALSPPTGANGVIIRPVSGAFTFTLKGVTGDTGVVLGAAATLPALPIVLPLGTAPSIGVTCTGAGVLEAIWF